MPTKAHLKYIILCPPRPCKQGSLAWEFPNIENGFKIILSMKFHHLKVLPNDQLLVFFNIVFPIFYKWVSNFFKNAVTLFCE